MEETLFKVWLPVQSSNLQYVWYDPDESILKITFHPGKHGYRIYSYSMVPPHIFQGLLSAPSKGKFHDQHIKWKYPFGRVA